jgi:hypothetical protein
VTPHRVYHARGTRSYIVCRDALRGLLFDAESGTAAGPHVRPGSATAHMGMVRWDQVHDEAASWPPAASASTPAAILV